MTPSIFNLFIFTPIISILLLAINFILAPHKPYKEKKTPFECGYHSFLAQNRTQFTISFFLFGILFLLFDIEIVIIYPITVSGYFNDYFGNLVLIFFVLILAAGLVFELGKGALKIETKQLRVLSHSVTSNKTTRYTSLRSLTLMNPLDMLSDDVLYRLIGFIIEIWLISLFNLGSVTVQAAAESLQTVPVTDSLVTSTDLTSLMMDGKGTPLQTLVCSDVPVAYTPQTTPVPIPPASE